MINETTGEIHTVVGIDREEIQADSISFVVIATDSEDPPLTGITVVNVVVEDINDNLPSFDQPNISIEEFELTSVSNFSFKVRCTNICLLIQLIY